MPGFLQINGNENDLIVHALPQGFPGAGWPISSVRPSADVVLVML